MVCCLKKNARHSRFYLDLFYLKMQIFDSEKDWPLVRFRLLKYSNRGRIAYSHNIQADNWGSFALL